MKEAAGEANMTVITIVLIAVVLGVGLIIVPKMMKRTSKSACCTNLGGVWKDNYCYNSEKCSTTATGEVSCPQSATISAICDDD